MDVPWKSGMMVGIGMIGMIGMIGFEFGSIPMYIPSFMRQYPVRSKVDHQLQQLQIVRALGVSLGGAMAWSQSRWITVGHCSPVITWLSLYFKVSSSRNAQDHGCWMFFVWYQNSSKYCTLWRREKSQEICATRIPIKTPTSLKKVAAAKVVMGQRKRLTSSQIAGLF